MVVLYNNGEWEVFDAFMGEHASYSEVSMFGKICKVWIQDTTVS